MKITGTFVGSLDPAEPIPNLSRAPRRPDGRESAKSGFVILAPESAAAGNRVLLFDVENNGRPVTHALYNTPNEGSIAQLDFGNGFIEDNGFIVAVADWQNGPASRCRSIQVRMVANAARGRRLCCDPRFRHVPALRGARPRPASPIR